MKGATHLGVVALFSCKTRGTTHQSERLTLRGGVSMEHFFIPKALNRPENVKPVKKIKREEPSEEVKADYKHLAELIDLASRSAQIHEDMNKFMDMMLIGSKVMLQRIKKAGYYTFDIVKRDFHVRHLDYYKKQEIRDNLERQQIRKLFKYCGVNLNDYIRVISAPNYNNRIVQLYIKHLLELCIEKGWLEISECAHGFVKQRNIKTNALYHFSRLYPQMMYERNEEIDNFIQNVEISEELVVNHISLRRKFSKTKQSRSKVIVNPKYTDTKLYSLGIDLENFFPSISRDRVIGFFTKKSNRNVARKIANCVCEKGKLVQGSILSPMITNLILCQMDKQIQTFCEKKNIVYSRYADDMLFSSKRRIDKSFCFQILYILKKFGLKANPKKIDFNTDIIDCNGLKINATNIRNGGEPIRVSKKFYKRTKFLVKVLNRALLLGFGKVHKRCGTGDVTKQAYKKLVQSNLHYLCEHIRDAHNIYSVSKGNLAHVALAKKFVSNNFNNTFIELYHLNANTGISIIDYSLLWWMFNSPVRQINC